MSNTFRNTDIHAVTEEKELELSLPPEGRKFTYTVSAKFTLYGFRDTRFGPKLYYTPRVNKSLRLRYAARRYELENVNGRYRLQETD